MASRSITVNFTTQLHKTAVKHLDEVMRNYDF